MPDGKSGRGIIRSIIVLGRNLDLTLIAKGVETGEQRAFLQAKGFHEAQGYALYGPNPAGELRMRR